MKCYNLDCKVNCDNITRATCFDKLSKEQYELKQLIRNSSNRYCIICNRETVKAKRYINNGGYVVIDLCTYCGIREDNIGVRQWENII